MSDSTGPRQGEFRGDFTRDTFDPTKHFRRVLMQQGRVQLDADWNEQASILLHQMRRLAADLIGPHGGPDGPNGPDTGFQIGKQKDGQALNGDFLIDAGRYYVDGILCENERAVTFLKHAFREKQRLTAGTYLAVLDVWERHVTYLQDDAIREVALGEADTATRSQVAARVRAMRLTDDSALKDLKKAATDVLASKTTTTQTALENALTSSPVALATNGGLRARSLMEEAPKQACTIAPDSRYRGANNQLYRVEIHRTGTAWDGEKKGTEKTAATFKWSRDNGAVAYAIREWDGGATATLASLGRDDVSRLRVDDWVEVVDDAMTLQVDDAMTLQGKQGRLLQVSEVSEEDLTVTFTIPSDVKELPRYVLNDPRHPLLRRWDHSERDGTLADGALLVRQLDGDEADQWIVLEDGVQIQFAKPDPNNPSKDPFNYRAGDYWLIPARTATGDVEWPEEREEKDGEPSKVKTYDDPNHPIPEALLPHGVEHVYAPLAVFVLSDPDATFTKDPVDLRRVFEPRTKMP